MDNQNIQLLDPIPPSTEGYFSIKYREDDGEWQEHFTKHNLIVNRARYIMAHLVGDCDFNGCINHFRMGGDQGLSNVEMLSPREPHPDDTNIVYTGNVFSRNSNDIVDGEIVWRTIYPNEPNETSVLFSIRIKRAEANLMLPAPTVYVCAGLFTHGGQHLFASQSFPVLTKTPNREFLIEWEIRF